MKAKIPLRHSTFLLRIAVLLGAVLILLGTPATAHAFTFTTIDVPGATSTEASGINARGQIVGHFLDASGAEHGFALVRGPTFITIDVPGATSTQAWDQCGGPDCG
jgi:probable HAF family extracellular repeat protein